MSYINIGIRDIVFKYLTYIQKWLKDMLYRLFSIVYFIWVCYKPRTLNPSCLMKIIVTIGMHSVFCDILPHSDTTRTECWYEKYSI